uniref:Uncharacterized protein n=1 Tax=Anopheles merus TaxID=30066 RepID=A0A182VIJ4_ANOME
MENIRSVTYTLQLAGELERRTANGMMMPSPVRMTPIEFIMMPSSTTGDGGSDGQHERGHTEAGMNRNHGGAELIVQKMVSTEAAISRIEETTTTSMYSNHAPQFQTRSSSSSYRL